MKICIIGQGYIGIPTAALFAENNCEVIGVDINERIVNSLNNLEVPIEEPGIEETIIKSLKNGNLRVQTRPEKADVFIITVPTPYIKQNFSCDLSYVISACNSILPYLSNNSIVIVESTISPLSMDNVIKPLFEKEGYVIGEDIFLAHCPERVLPGQILHELVYNNRIIGGITPRCAEKAAGIYSIFVKGEIIQTEAKTAELSKCMENTFRDVNIALVNELVKICSEIGVDALEVINLANKHPRVNLHSPGPGVGGHCLAIDPYFIYSKAPESAKLIKLARDINSSMPNFVVSAVNNLLKNKGYTPKITIFGVAYKGDIDDDRESPAYDVIAGLRNHFEINIYDPHVPIENSLSLEDAVEDSDLILILTDHTEFKLFNYNELSKNMKAPLIFDTKNIFDKDDSKISECTLINFGNLYQYQ